MIYTFDAEKHYHFLDGRRAPGVTTILTAEGYVSFPKFINMEEYQYRGNYVHLACHLLNQGKLDFSTLKPEFKGYIAGYMKWVAATGAKALASEVSVYSPIWRYCGIIDSVQQMPDGVTLVDIKTSKTEGKSWKYQMAGYSLAYAECPEIKALGLPPIQRRLALQLAADGTYKERPYLDKNDARKWMVILSSYSQKVAEGIIKMGDEIDAE